MDEETKSGPSTVSAHPSGRSREAIKTTINNEYKLARDGKEWLVLRSGREIMRTDNALEAYTAYADGRDAEMRRAIGDMLEKEGRNRYTGEPDV